MLEPVERPPIAGEPLALILLVSGPTVGLEDAVARWADQVLVHRPDNKLILVDVSGGDAARASAAALAGRLPTLRWTSSSARGIGAALTSGLAQAQQPLVAFAPCDGSYNPADLGRLLIQIDRVDLVSGRRTWPRGAGAGLAAWLRRLVVRLLVGVRLRDVESTLLLARRAAFRRIRLQSEGPLVVAEILAKANFLGQVMTEMPVTYQPREGAHQAWQPVDGSQWWADLKHLLRDPDFGPADLPDSELPAPPTIPGVPLDPNAAVPLA